jgi:hypothetical protein
MGERYEYRRMVTHRCGHTETHKLNSHNRPEADAFAHNLRKGDCTTCRDMAREFDKSKQKIDLPNLFGDPDQVRKAIYIRQRIYKALSGMNLFNDKAHLCQNEIRAEWWIAHDSDRLKVIVGHLFNAERKAA